MKKIQYVGCFLALSKDEYLFQERDNDPRISNPGMVSTFGGRVEAGEDAFSALTRELREELEIEIDLARLTFLGYAERYDEIRGHVVGCAYYFYSIKRMPLECHEGRPVRIGCREILTSPYVGGMTKEMFVRVKMMKALRLI